jgi:hypothetical protein
MRAVLLIIIVAILAALVALATGLLHVTQKQDARAPQVSATHNGVTAKGGQPPAFEIETGSVEVGTRKATVKVPDLRVRPPADAPANQVTAPAANNS